MRNRIYDCYTAIFGHSRFLNTFINKFSNSSICMKHPVSIGRGTKIIGNVDINKGVNILKNTFINGVHGKIDIGKNVCIKSNVLITRNVRIQKHTKLHERNWVRGSVDIGKFCDIGPRVRMLSFNHCMHKPGKQGKLYNNLGLSLGSVSKGPIKIGHDVWIGSDSKILQNVEIGNGAIIGANSVVVDDVEPYSIVAGNPATHKKYLFEKSKRDELQEIAWWDWNQKERRQNIEFFDTDLRKVDNVLSLIK